MVKRVSKRVSEIVFLIAAGGSTYYLIEIWFRGFSHWTMFVLGGVALTFCSFQGEVMHWSEPMWIQIIRAVLFLTSLEFMTGIICNKWLKIGIWDYRMNETQIAKIREISHAHKKENAVKIAFAGNLNKSEFLSAMEIPSDVRMELWGKLDPEREKTLAEGCHYHGILSSDEIPFAVGEMDYGLVWDGSGKDEIEGGLGEYLRYNNSHKCALYLASGIPVIVWSRSGMANFVREHACGITIDRLGDLDQAIHTADYEKLKEAALAVAPKLWEGYYLSQAIDSACG